MPARDREREWVAALQFSADLSFAGRLSKLTGTLVLTDDAIVFRPLAGLGRRKEIRLEDIEDVRAFAAKPPRLRVTPRGAKPVMFAIVPKRTTWAWAWSEDTSARDTAVAAIRAALARSP
jgi:hypothetical protein